MKNYLLYFDNEYVTSDYYLVHKNEDELTPEEEEKLDEASIFFLKDTCSYEDDPDPWYSWHIVDLTEKDNPADFKEFTL